MLSYTPITRTAVICLWLFTFLNSCQIAFAINAAPHAVELHQPDGTPIQLQLRGNEYLHWYEDLDGYSVVERNDGNYVYVELGPRGSLQGSDRIVGKDSPREGARKHLMPPRVRMPGGVPLLPQRLSQAPRVNSVGNVKNLVILMRFQDHQNRTVPTREDFDKIFNAPGGHPLLAPTGSVKDYYLENSYGQLQLNSTVFQWVTLPRTEAYYAAGESGLTLRITEAIRDALAAADSMVDFSSFDQNQDGWVDAIAFVHSGYGAEWGGIDSSGADFKNRIWSHRWSISPWTSAEGVKVSDYHINPGLWGTSGSDPGRIGVICHETGHFFGLPDLYDTSQAGEGIGSWGLMANSWGFDGSQHKPPHFSAWSKIFLGWLSATPLSSPGTYSLHQSETTTNGQLPTVYRLNSGYPPGEYLLIENRQPFGFDSGIPASGAGLAIWHIDEFKAANNDPGYPSQPGWPENNRHYMVALLQADGAFDLEQGTNRGDAKDTFRSGHASQLTPSTVPNSNGYQFGNVSTPAFSIQEISSSGSEMTFQLVPLRQRSVPEIAPASRLPGSDRTEIFRAAQSYAATICEPNSPQYFEAISQALQYAEVAHQTRRQNQMRSRTVSPNTDSLQHSIAAQYRRQNVKPRRAGIPFQRCHSSLLSKS